MALTDTKQKILEASLSLFNENGISNVRLQQIADETGISVGNLAYHFSNKEAIAESLITQVINGLQNVLRTYGTHESLDDLDFFFAEFYQVCSQYNFFSFDILEIKRSYPVLYEALQQVFIKIRLQIERRLELYQKQRLLQPDMIIKNIAANLWLLLFFMPAEAQLMSKKTIPDYAYRRRLWEYIMLYFTSKGSSEYIDIIEPTFVSR
jgi:AcrR family transcriptional regulator